MSDEHSKEETVRTVILMETEGHYDILNGGLLVESAVVEVSKSMFENEEIIDWDPIKVIERCGHRHRQGSNACRQCNIRMGGGGW